MRQYEGNIFIIIKNDTNMGLLSHILKEETNMEQGTIQTLVCSQS